MKLLALLLLAAACDTAPDHLAPDCAADDSGVHNVCLVVKPDDWRLLNADPQGHVEVPVDLVLDGQHLPAAGLELHGGYARTVPKRSYRLRFADDAVALPLFDGQVEEHKRVVLQAAWIDPTFLRNALIFELLRASGGLAPRVAFARVFVNGERLGFFQMIERIDKHYLRRQGLGEGTLYKAEGNEADWGPAADPLEGLEQELGEPSPDLGDLLTLVNTSPLDTDALEASLSIDDVFAYQRVHSLAMDRDAYSKNYYLAHTPGRPFRLISWDADATYCQRWDGVPLSPDGATDDRWHGWDVLSAKLFGPYTSAYASDYRAALDDELAAAAILERLDRLAAQVGSDAREDLARWQPDLDWDAEVERLRACVTAREARLRAILPD